MKKILTAVLVFLMVFGCAYAENTGFAPVELAADAGLETDLDGDGVNEYVTWTSVPLDEYDSEAVVTVINMDGEEIGWHSGMLHGVKVWVTDIDGNGLKEIFVSGDQMSDDYTTFCLNFTGTMLEQLLFADVNRGQDNGGYYPWGYGMITEIDGDVIQLTGSQDMLGTWMASRRFCLIDGILEIVDDGYWFCDVDVNDPEAWEYRSLNPVREIPVTFVEEYEMVDGVLKPGERIILTRFDKYDAFFVTEDDRFGFISAERDEENWYWTIDGIPEYEMFEYVPYAD